MFDNFILIVILIWHTIKTNVWAALISLAVLLVCSLAAYKTYHSMGEAPLLKCYDRVLEKKGSIVQADKDECKELINLLQ